MSAKPSSVSASSEYSEGSIRVLKGLEPVKQRPGMYTRTDNPLHIIQEVLDNAADEALAGHGKKIRVTLHADGSVSVEDDGRGIPFGLHPEEKAPVIELVFTRLHAGGKFDKGKGGAYSFSGGLHGVGVSVTNALATRLEATSYREGKAARLVFAAGDVVEPLVSRPLEAGERKQGTSVRVWPDAKYFESSALPMGELTHLLRSKAVLMPGVTVQLVNEKTRDTQTWQYKGGLRDYLMQTLNAEPVIPLFEGEGFADRNNESFAEGEGASWCVAFTEDGAPMRESYVNLIPTSAGGTHESGLRDGLFNAVKSFIELHSLLPKGVKLLPEDVFARASYVLSAKVLDPQFQGQIKERLNSRDAVRLVSGFVRPALELWLNQHVEYGKKLAELAIKAAQTRQKAGQKVEKRKGSGVAVLPASSPTARAATRPTTKSSWSRGTRPAAAPRWAATRKARPSCRCVAKCSTPGRLSATGCSPTTRSTTSRWRLAWIRTARTIPPTSRACATARSASCRTRTWTARTSRCCCSRCFSVTSPSSSRRATFTWRARRCSGWTCPPVARSLPPRCMRWTMAS